MKNTTLCYIQRGNQYLMLHRVKKKNDLNEGKWVGIGGHFEENESPEDCVLREAREETGLTLLYETVGQGTQALRALPLGTELDLLTGLGNGFDLSPAGQTPLLVGGGSGLSPLYGLAKRLLQQGAEPRVILGFRSREDMFFLRSFHELGLYPSITTEDGSFGIRGFVTEAMNLPHSYLYACGPEAMLRAVSERSETGGQLSFDVRMGCGFGACMGCTKQTVNGPRRVCKDGPVFRKEEILWDA